MPYTLTGSLPFAKDSETSYRAALKQVGTRGAKTQAYLRLLAREGPLTDHQSAAFLKLPLSSICSIRNNAVGCLLVEKGSTKRPGPHGCDCSVWFLTAAGRHVVNSWAKVGESR